MSEVRWRCFNCKNVSEGPLRRCEVCNYTVAEAVDRNGNTLVQAFTTPEAAPEAPERMPWQFKAVIVLCVAYGVILFVAIGVMASAKC